MITRPPAMSTSGPPFIAGTLPNDQAHLVRWIRDPHAIDPRTAMPVLGVSARDALDMSAYLLAH